MTPDRLLRREDHGAVARLVMTSPDTLNALSRAMITALSDALATPVDGLAADAVGLHRALLIIVPLGLAIAVLGSWRASRALPHDRDAMTKGVTPAA